MTNKCEAQARLNDFDALVARDLPRHCSADAYLYWDNDKLQLGVTMFEVCTTEPAFDKSPSSQALQFLGAEDSSMTVDSVGVFETDLYMSEMHGGHGGGKTSSFKRCMFLKHIGTSEVASALVTALEIRPTPLCYLHLLRGGGAVAEVPHDATAFGCRDWDFACVITGIWPRNQDGTEVARAAVRWVYNTAKALLPMSSGVYGADLGPDLETQRSQPRHLDGTGPAWPA